MVGMENRSLGAGVSHCTEDPLMAFGRCLPFSLVVVSLTNIPISILTFIRLLSFLIFNKHITRMDILNQDFFFS